MAEASERYCGEGRIETAYHASVARAVPGWLALMRSVFNFCALDTQSAILQHSRGP